MKIEMKKAMLLLILFIIGLMPTLVAPAPVPFATLTTSKYSYSVGEPVDFTLTNTGTVPISFDMDNLWVVHKEQPDGTWITVFVPAVQTIGWTLDPGDSKTWEWLQDTNVAGVSIDAGTYNVEILVLGVGSCSTTFTLEKGICLGSFLLSIFIVAGLFLYKRT
jgi:hypothetical protein